MLSFAKFITLAVLVVFSFAARPLVGRRTSCPGAGVIKDTTVDVARGKVHFTTLSCQAPAAVRRGVSDYLPAPKNVCGEICNTTCNKNAGSLPPTTQDCDQIKDAILILQDHQEPTFVVEPYNSQILTFGTCSFFFVNTGSNRLQYCWSDMSITGSEAGSACFPPVQPLNSKGLCSAGDGTWAVGAAHSSPSPSPSPSSGY